MQCSFLRRAIESNVMGPGNNAGNGRQADHEENEAGKRGLF
jgi:hypothetical protein